MISVIRYFISRINDAHSIDYDDFGCEDYMAWDMTLNGDTTPETVEDALPNRVIIVDEEPTDDYLIAKVPDSLKESFIHVILNELDGKVSLSGGSYYVDPW